MPVSLKDIADRCGVSRQAVSNALTGSGRLKPETRRTIQQVAHELGYRPNTIARTMRTGRFGSLAMLTRAEMGPIQLNLNKGAFAEASSRDLHLAYTEVAFERLVDPGYAPKVLRELCVDGLLVHYAWDIPHASIERIRNSETPTVWINTQDDLDCVYPDDQQGAEIATAQLIEAGHRRIAYMSRNPAGPQISHYSTEARRAGYARTMQDAGLEPVFIDMAYPTPKPDYPTRVSAWLKAVRGQAKTTAMLCANDKIAMSVLIAAATLGRSVPHDLSLITFTNSGNESLPQPISAMRVPMAEVGRSAVKMLCRKIKNTNKPVNSIAVPYAKPSYDTIHPLSER